MLYKITDVEFDFEDSYGEFPYDEQVALVQSVLDDVWEVENEEDLTDVITDDTGWCIKSLNYVVFTESH
jgi:hypothetical protein